MNLTAISAIIAIIISFIGLVIQLVAVGIYIGKLEGFKDLVNYKFAEQKDRLDKHNYFITRLYEVERRQRIDEEKIDVANQRIADLANKGV